MPQPLFAYALQTTPRASDPNIAIVLMVIAVLGIALVWWMTKSAKV